MVNESSSENPGQNQSIHLVVVELHHHSDLIDNLIQVLRRACFRITLITVNSVYENIGHDWSQTGEWLQAFCQEDHEDVAQYIERMGPIFESADLLYFNTVRHFWAELNAIPRSCPAILRVHNVHTDLAPASHFDRPLLMFPAILSHLIRKVWIGGEWRKRKQFLARIDYLMFPNQAITDYVCRHKWVDETRILPPIVPFAFLGEPRTSKKTNQHAGVTVAITGKVTNSKKDYDLVFQALKRCLHRLDSPVRLMLLGKAGDRHAARIVADFHSLESDKFSLDHSTSYISPEEFEHKIAEVDFLLAPIRVQTHFRKYREIYGKSKMSGIENDILLYRKPSLVTSIYGIQGEIGKVVEYFEPTPESLSDSIISWVNDYKYEDFNRHFDAISQYHPEVVAQQFYCLCRNLIPNVQLQVEN